LNGKSSVNLQKRNNRDPTVGEDSFHQELSATRTANREDQANIKKMLDFEPYALLFQGAADVSPIFLSLEHLTFFLVSEAMTAVPRLLAGSQVDWGAGERAFQGVELTENADSRLMTCISGRWLDPPSNSGSICAHISDIVLFLFVSKIEAIVGVGGIGLHRGEHKPRFLGVLRLIVRFAMPGLGWR
jgi:hypothetical protein